MKLDNKHHSSNSGLIRDMQRILVETKRKYDEVLVDGERKEQELTRIRDSIRLWEAAKEEEERTQRSLGLLQPTSSSGNGNNAPAAGAGLSAGTTGGLNKASSASSSSYAGGFNRNGTTGAAAGTSGAGGSSSSDQIHSSSGTSGGDQQIMPHDPNYTTNAANAAGGSTTMNSASDQDLLSQDPNALQIEDLEVSRKVYKHILERSRTELGVLRQRLLKLEGLLDKRTLEEEGKLALSRKLTQAKQHKQHELDKLEVSRSEHNT